MNPDEVYLGLTWRDMPSHMNDMKKMNFSLFKKGKLNPKHLEGRLGDKELRFYKETFFGAVKRGRYREEKLNTEQK